MFSFVKLMKLCFMKLIDTHCLFGLCSIGLCTNWSFVQLDHLLIGHVRSPPKMNRTGLAHDHEPWLRRCRQNLNRPDLHLNTSERGGSADLSENYRNDEEDKRIRRWTAPDGVERPHRRSSNEKSTTAPPVLGRDNRFFLGLFFSQFLK